MYKNMPFLAYILFHFTLHVTTTVFFLFVFLLLLFVFCFFFGGGGGLKTCPSFLPIIPEFACKQFDHF